MIGSIPKAITIFKQPKQTICLDSDDEDCVPEKFFEVYPAMVSDSLNRKTCESARKWASRYNHEPYQEITKENIPFTNIKVIALDYRGQGGRAWKITTEEGYYFDLREDVLLDSMINCGVVKGGIVLGDFIWAKLGSQIRIVRCGSDLYNEIVKSEERLKKKAITDLEYGWVYRNSVGKEFLFLGYVDHGNSKRSALVYSNTRSVDYLEDFLKNGKNYCYNLQIVKKIKLVEKLYKQEGIENIDAVNTIKQNLNEIMEKDNLERKYMEREYGDLLTMVPGS